MSNAKRTPGHWSREALRYSDRVSMKIPSLIAHHDELRRESERIAERDDRQVVSPGDVAEASILVSARHALDEADGKEGEREPDESADEDPTTWTGFETISNAIGLAKRYLEKRGIQTDGHGWESEDEKYSVPILAREDDGEVVLIDVRAEVDVDSDARSMPSLEVDAETYDRYRSTTLTYLLTHPEVNRARFDVIAVRFIGEKNARLRHLVGSVVWDG